jgi:penicillin-binding protein 1A
VALARSLNMPAVKLIRDLGPEQVVELASRLGIRSRLDPVASLALGSSAVTPLELASAYATLAAGGEYRQPHIVERIVGPDGVEIPLVGRAKARVVTPDEAYLITSLLRSVVTAGTGRKARALGRPVAGKTGTSNKARDAWFAGYSPDVAAATWVGYDDSLSIGRREYGGRAALPIWIEVMRAAHGGKPVRDFEPPPGLVTARIDPASGLLAWEEMEDAIEEIYIEGTAPTEQALPPELVSLDDFALEQLAGGADGGPGDEPRRDAGAE